MHADAMSNDISLNKQSVGIAAAASALYHWKKLSKVKRCYDTSGV